MNLLGLSLKKSRLLVRLALGSGMLSAGRIALLLLLLESALLSLIGGLVGVAIALGFHGLTINHHDTLIYSVHLTPQEIWGGLRMALYIGVIGGLVAVTQGSRMKILDSLRGH